MMINRSFTLQTLKKLVQINSVNPSLEEQGAGEENIAKYIYELLLELGVEAECDEIAPGRVNVIGTIKGEGTGPSLMLNAHTDTVGVKGMSDPFSGNISGGKLFGRGSYDMKGSIAAIIAVAKAIKEKNVVPKGDLVLSFVADEEYESIGAQALVKKIKTDYAIVTEPTDLNLCTAHRGFGIWKITTKGKTAHGGNHHLGIDANANMGLLLSELHIKARDLQSQYSHKLCGEASMHIPLIEGGRSLFIYSNECTIYVERRTLPGETQVETELAFRDIISRIEDANPDFRAFIEPVIWRGPYEIDDSAAIVKQAMSEVEKITGKAPKIIGHSWWEDSAIFGEAGIQTVILGPKGGGIHEDEEWVEIDSVIQLGDILFDLAVNAVYQGD